MNKVTQASGTQALSSSDLEQRLGCLPHVQLAHVPTPLDELPRLTRALGGPRILMKRDDLSGFALGGNKPRKLEFLMGAAVATGADSIVISAAAQSNMVRMTCAAAAKLGLDTYAVLRGAPDEEIQGNLLLDYLFGARVTFINTRDPYSQLSVDTMRRIIADLRAAGRRPYLLDMRYESGPLAALGYVAASIELARQLEQRDLHPTHLFVSTGSGTTLAGLVLGASLLALEYEVTGISVQIRGEQLVPRIEEKIALAAGLLRLQTPLLHQAIVVDDEYIGEAYGIPTTQGTEALKMVARTEGIILDPVYTAKGMSGLIGWIRHGRLSADDTVVFLHTGGVPGLFAHAHDLGPLLASS